MKVGHPLWAIPSRERTALAAFDAWPHCHKRESQCKQFTCKWENKSADHKIPVVPRPMALKGQRRAAGHMVNLTIKRVIWPLCDRFVSHYAHGIHVICMKFWMGFCSYGSHWGSDAQFWIWKGKYIETSVKFQVCEEFCKDWWMVEFNIT